MKRKGFTLVELLIVIAILGVLTAMVQLSGTNAAASAKAAAITNGLNTIKTAGKMYIAENAASNLSFDGFKGALSSYAEVGNNFGVSEDNKKWVAYYTFAESDTSAIKAKLGKTSSDKTVMLEIYDPGE